MQGRNMCREGGGGPPDDIFQKAKSLDDIFQTAAGPDDVFSEGGGPLTRTHCPWHRAVAAILTNTDDARRPRSETASIGGSGT